MNPKKSLYFETQFTLKEVQNLDFLLVQFYFDFIYN